MSLLLCKVVGKRQVEMGFLGTCVDNSRPSCSLGSHTSCDDVSLFTRKLNDVEASDFFFLSTET